MGPTRQPLGREERGGRRWWARWRERAGGGKRCCCCWPLGWGGEWAEGQDRERRGLSFYFLFFKQNFKALLNLNFDPKLFCSNSHFTK